MNFQHTQKTPANIIGVVPFGQEPIQMLYTSLPFFPYLCICQGVLTSPRIRSYNNETSGGDAASEITKTQEMHQVVIWLMRSQKTNKCIKW